MASSFEPGEWRDFFIATSGAGAALAGLVFVAISINLREILQYPGLTGRAAEAFTLLMSVVLVGVVGAAPAESAATLGWELAGLGAGVWLTVTVILVRASGQKLQVTRAQWIQRIVSAELPPLLIVVAGASTAWGLGLGLHWLILASLFAFIAGVVDAWVLLIEILR